MTSIWFVAKKLKNQNQLSVNNAKQRGSTFDSRCFNSKKHLHKTKRDVEQTNKKQAACNCGEDVLYYVQK